MPENALSKLISAAQLSRKLGGNPKARTILKHARNGWIPCLKLGKKIVRFDFEKVKAKMDENSKPK